MPIPAMFLHACLFSLSQAAGLIQSPLDSLPLDREPWENLPVGTRVVLTQIGIDSTEAKTDSSFVEIHVRPERVYDILESRFQSLPTMREARRQSYGISRQHPPDSGASLEGPDPSSLKLARKYRKESSAHLDRWITTMYSTDRPDSTFDTLEISKESGNGVFWQRRTSSGGRIRIDSVWRDPNGRPVRGTETSSATDPSVKSATLKVKHAWGWLEGHLAADTIHGAGAQGQLGGDTTWIDTLRYTWENGRLVRFTSAIDSAWMEWSAQGTPLHFLRRTWSPRFPSPSSTRRVTIQETGWDPQGRQTSRIYASESSVDIDTMLYEGASPFPSRSSWTYCSSDAAKVFDRSQMKCRKESSELYTTRVFEVAIRKPAKGFLGATIRMQGKKVIFQNLSIGNGTLELVSLEGKSLSRTPVLDGQATLAHPPRGVCLWRVRSPTGAVSEASRLILP